MWWLTIVATGCTATMSGTAVVLVNPLPTVFNVTGGGGYCATTTNGVPVGLNGSTIGVNYQLYYTPSRWFYYNGWRPGTRYRVCNHIYQWHRCRRYLHKRRFLHCSSYQPKLQRMSK